LRIIAIIPARGGSKRLKKKNIYLFKGNPLIFYAIKACKQSKKIDEIYVSSDDDEILNISKNFGAKPLKRHPNISDDKTPKIVAVREVLKHEQLLKDGRPDIVIIPQANSPEITCKEIEKGIDFMIKHNLWEVMSADRNGIQNAAYRIIRADKIENNYLSAHCGFITFDCADIHTIEDLNKLENSVTSF
jgi:CMP-N,N'-diacetyllegionaminic acid synthase